MSIFSWKEIAEKGGGKHPNFLMLSWSIWFNILVIKLLFLVLKQFLPKNGKLKWSSNMGIKQTLFILC